MEEELKCPVCKDLFDNPVLMPCYHTLCLNCALALQSQSDQVAAAAAEEVDKLSILSETDSGVVCTSRPNSYVGTPNMQGVLFPPLSNGGTLALACPLCSKTVYFDDNGAFNLPKYRAMKNIVEKYGESKQASPHKCDLCPPSQPARAATVHCEQCQVFYCEECKDNCHPARGALAKHVLVAASASSRSSLAARQNPSNNSVLHCTDHQEEPLTYYCMLCKLPACSLCRDSRHSSHDVQAVNTMCKAQKVNNPFLLHVAFSNPDVCTNCNNVMMVLDDFFIGQVVNFCGKIFL
ncbi:hypothetical protein AAG570_006599 [Ranatra chinensis]|uniref:B box-type domain-containing protein n=1 Tax=Ranatra chinensis TaxID=642074 RepID=A0ABD0Z521_9HEMI